MASEGEQPPVRTEEYHDPTALEGKSLGGSADAAFAGTDFGFEWTETTETGAVPPADSVIAEPTEGYKAEPVAQDRLEPRKGPERRGIVAGTLAVVAVVGGLIIFRGGDDGTQPPRAGGLHAAPAAANCATPSAQRRSEIEEILSRPVASNSADAYARANNLTIERDYTTPYVIEYELGAFGKVAFSARLRQANSDLKQFGITVRVTRPSDRLPDGLHAPSPEELASGKTAAVLDAIDNGVSTLPIEYVRAGGQKTIILATGESSAEYVYPTKANTTIAYNLAAGPDESAMAGVIYQVYDDAACSGNTDPGFAKLHNAKRHDTATALLGVNAEDGSIGLLDPNPFYDLNGAIDRQNVDDYCAARHAIAGQNIQDVFGQVDITNDKRAVATLFNRSYVTPYIAGPDTDAPVLRKKLIFLLARLPERFGEYFAKLNARYENPKKETLPLHCE